MRPVECLLLPPLSIQLLCFVGLRGFDVPEGTVFRSNTVVLPYVLNRGLRSVFSATAYIRPITRYKRLISWSNCAEFIGLSVGLLGKVRLHWRLSLARDTLVTVLHTSAYTCFHRPHSIEIESSITDINTAWFMHVTIELRTLVVDLRLASPFESYFSDFYDSTWYLPHCDSRETFQSLSL